MDIHGCPRYSIYIYITAFLRRCRCCLSPSPEVMIEGHTQCSHCADTPSLGPSRELQMTTVAPNAPVLVELDAQSTDDVPVRKVEDHISRRKMRTWWHVSCSCINPFTIAVQKQEVVVLWNIQPNSHRRLCQGLFGVDDSMEILRSTCSLQCKRIHNSLKRAAELPHSSTLMDDLSSSFTICHLHSSSTFTFGGCETHQAS